MTSYLRNRVEQIAPWVKMFNFYSVSECHDVTCAGKLLFIEFNVNFFFLIFEIRKLLLENR